MIYKANLDEQQYQQLRQASMRGKLLANFWQDDNVTKFSTKNTDELISDLNNIFGGGTAKWKKVLDEGKKL